MDRIRGVAGTFFEQDEDEILGAIERIFTLHMEAKAGGLLALESSKAFEEDFLGKHFLQKAVMYVTDGIATEKMDRLLTNRILADTDEKKQFVCLMYKAGIEGIQRGEISYYLQEEICSLFPEEYENEVREFIDDILGANAIHF